MAQNIQLFGPREGFLTHQWIIAGNKQITDKYYDETKMRTRQKQRVATDTWRILGCRTTPLEHWGKRKPTVEPRWAKQQTKRLRPQPTKINSFMSGPSLSLTYMWDVCRVLRKRACWSQFWGEKQLLIYYSGGSFLGEVLKKITVL